MAESALNTRLLKALRPFDPVRVENSACPGTPDINCTLGWIESKYLERWPTRVDIVRCDHFTAQQRVWAIKRNHAGGNVWFMIQVGTDYLLYWGHDAAEIIGKVNRQTMESRCLCRWEGQLGSNKAVQSVFLNPRNPELWIKE